MLRSARRAHLEARRRDHSGVKRFDNGARRAVEPAAHSRESGSASSGAGPVRPSSRGAGTIGTPTRKLQMTKRLESKYKIDRRLGINLWGRPKSPINKRDYGPGQHGQRRKKPSDYGVQLMAKQKLKGYYGNIGERQFRRLYEEASRRRGDTSENL